MFDPHAIKAKKRLPTTAEANDPNWVQFWDMHSGGRTKVEPFDKIYLQVPEGADPAVVFQNLFDRSPDRVTCTCCGADYSYDGRQTLLEATAFHRDCDFDRETNSYVERGKPEEPERRYRLRGKLVEEDSKIIVSDAKLTVETVEKPRLPFTSIEEYVQEERVLIVFADEMPADVGEGTVRTEGYVWSGG